MTRIQRNSVLKIFHLVISFVYYIGLIFILQYCSQIPEEKYIEILISNLELEGTPGKLSITYPSDGTIFPPEIVPPTFIWNETNQTANKWLVIVDLDNEDERITVFTEKKIWRPTSDQWEIIKKHSIEKDIQITVLGNNSDEPEKIASGSSITIRTSEDKVGAPIFFRAVTLPFEFTVNNLHTVSWHLGNIASESQPPAVLKDMPLCGNCHSFSSDGKILAMDVDYANDKGSYVITNFTEETILSQDKIITWSDYKRDEEEYTFGLLSQISPNGRYVLSTVKDRSIFVPKDDLYYSQLFFPIKGIIAVYDRETQKYWSLPGADDPQNVQSNASWSPDGKYILFARAPYRKHKVIESSNTVVLPTEAATDYIEGKRSFQYNLFRISFNEGKGGNPEPLPGASNNGKSNYFAKYSPDGKWIIFTQAQNFMLLQPDSKLFILPAAGGEPREMTCNTTNMNSWHSWSPNGKWLVFSSKERGAYTQLYLTHIDENGYDSPPVLLENFMIPNRGANIPEFVNINPDQDINLIENFMYSGNYFLRIGYFKFESGNFNEALEALNQAILQSPEEPLAYVYRGQVKERLGDITGAIKDCNQAIQIDPENVIAYNSRGIVHTSLKNYKEAMDDFNKVISLDPTCDEAYVNRGIIKVYQGFSREAIDDFNAAIEINPDNETAYSHKKTVVDNMSKNPLKTP